MAIRNIFRIFRYKFKIKVMKKVLWIVSIVSMLVASYEFLEGRTEETILFTVWSFYLKYLADKSE